MDASPSASPESSDFARSAAFAQRLLALPSTGSTNADLVAAASTSPESWPDGSVLLTTDQRRGRGRLDRAWTTPPGSALAVSVLVRVDGIAMDARGWLSLIAGIAMTRAVARALAGSPHSARLKWPNDVLVDGRKISGILAEVVPAVPDTVVIGAGVNTAMTAEQLPIETATSFAALGVEVDADALLVDYLTALREHRDALRAAGSDAVVAGVHAEAVAVCDTLGRAVRVHLPGGGFLAGEAVGIDASGRLEVRSADGVVAVAAGDVVHVR